MEKKIKKIILDGGETFEGTVDQFRDCFFDNAEEEVIRDWAEKENMKLEIIYE